MPDLMRTWQDVAHTLGAELDYADERNTAYRLERIDLRVRHRYWTMEFACKAKHPPHKGKRSGNSRANAALEAYTRLRCAIHNPEQFRFSLYEEKLTDRLYKIIGLQDILVGDAPIDKRFIIQSNDAEKIRCLFGLPAVRAAFASPHVQHLRLIDDEPSAEAPLPPGVDLLYGRSDHRMDKTEEILAYFQLFSATLDGLLELGYIQAEA
jgi:hypothetical protein